MKRLFPFLFLGLFLQFAHATEQRRSSVFEHYVQSRNHFSANPFDLFFDIRLWLSQEGHHDYYVPIFGRSPEASFIEAEFPRLLFSMRFDRKGQRGGIPPEIFIGHVEPDQGNFQIISWNRNVYPRQYDFIRARIDDFGKLTLLPTERNECLVCHQNGGPIFPGAPWTETENAPERFEISISPPEYDSSPFLYNYYLQKSPLGFNEDVFAAAKALQANQVCSELCQAGEEDLVCKKYLLFFAILGTHPATRRADFEFDQIKEEFTSLVKEKWPKSEFAYPSPILIDRDPYALNGLGVSTLYYLPLNEAQKVFSRKDEGLKIPNLMVQDIDESVESVMKRNLKNDSLVTFADKSQGYIINFIDEIFSFEEVDPAKIPGLRDAKIYGNPQGAWSDPAVKRPNTGYLSLEDVGRLTRSMKYCFEFSESFLNKMAKMGLSRLSQTIMNDEVIAESLTRWPDKQSVSEQIVTQALERSYEADRRLGEYFGGPGISFPKETTKKVSHSRVTTLINKYCMECHDGSSKTPAFDPDNPDALRTLRTKKGFSVIDRILGTPGSGRQMPPNRDRVDWVESELREIIQYLREGP